MQQGWYLNAQNFPQRREARHLIAERFECAAIGIARNTPATPQMNHPNNTQIMTASGLSFSRPA